MSVIILSCPRPQSATPWSQGSGRRVSQAALIAAAFLLLFGNAPQAEEVTVPLTPPAEGTDGEEAMTVSPEATSQTDPAEDPAPPADQITADELERETAAPPAIEFSTFGSDGTDPVAPDSGRETGPVPSPVMAPDRSARADEKEPSDEPAAQEEPADTRTEEPAAAPEEEPESDSEEETGTDAPGDTDAETAPSDDPEADTSDPAVDPETEAGSEPATDPAPDPVTEPGTDGDTDLGSGEAPLEPMDPFDPLDPADDMEAWDRPDAVPAPRALPPLRSKAATPRTVGAYAAVYRAVMRDMASFSTLSFSQTDAITHAERVVRGYDPAAVARGWFAHHGIVAANHPAFFDAVRRRAGAMGRQAFVSWITNDPSQLRSAPGAGAALQRVQDSVNDETSQMAAMGALLLGRALDMQAERLNDDALRSLMFRENARALVPEFDLAGRYRPDAVSDPARRTFDRVLLVASLLALGTGEGPDRFQALETLSDRAMERCIAEAQLNLGLCQATARYGDERAFCVGRHGIEEIGQCWRPLIEPTR